LQQLVPLDRLLGGREVPGGFRLEEPVPPLRGGPGRKKGGCMR